MYNRTDFLDMEHAQVARLAPLMAAARAVRHMQWGKTVTYSRKVFIPLTNLCRDSCGYCTFAKQPGTPGAGYMTPDEVLAVARQGERLGCKEALFSLGERPELRYPEARQMLQALGYATTMEYVVAMCQRILRETSLIPHVNAGTLTEEEVRQLKGVAGSIGLMLENISKRLMAKDMPHYACPDKVPLQRIRTLQRAGMERIATTTGILIGIGETWTERVDSLYAIAELHQKYGHIQEVIVQNFRAKPGTPMAHWAEPDMHDMLKTLTLARLLLPAEISLQAPPNLAEKFEQYLHAGINDWGGISPLTIDHINPERAWPALQEVVRRTAREGLMLRERLTTYPRYLRAAHHFIGPMPFVALAQQARPDGLARQQMIHEELAA